MNSSRHNHTNQIKARLKKRSRIYFNLGRNALKVYENKSMLIGMRKKKILDVIRGDGYDQKLYIDENFSLQAIVMHS